MQKDFYLNDRSLAAYLEKDWFDYILTAGGARKPSFTYAPFEASALYSDYHERLVGFLAAILAKENVEPRSMLEVGSSLGRTYFEVCNRLKGMEMATLIEPSQNLYSLFRKIFSGDEEVTAAPVLKGNLEMDEVLLNTRQIRAACAAVKMTALNVPFQKINQDLGLFDMVICSNVIDQCEDHFQLAEFLKRSTAPGGTLLLSCTYQWSYKYTGNAGKTVRDINDLFSAEWKFKGETNLPFQFRVNERHWMNFLSHAVVYQREP